MPERKKFKVRRGERVTVGVNESDRDAERKPRPEPPRAALTPDDEEDLYLRRPVPAIQLLDLGTRLLSHAPSSELVAFREPGATDTPEPDDEAGHVNSYGEVLLDAEAAEIYALPSGLPQSVYDPYSLGTQHLQASMSGADAAAFDAALLGSRAPGSEDPLDPLGFTKANGSGKKLPNCLPLWYGNDNQDETVEDYKAGSSGGFPPEIVDVILYDDDGEQYVLPNSKARERARDVRWWIADVTDEGASIDTGAIWRDEMRFVGNPGWTKRERKDGERWSEAAEEYKQPDSGYTDPREKENKVKGRGNLRVESRLVFESFDTGDGENFKITREPDPDAEEVEFVFRPATPVRIFLKPVYLAWGRFFRFQYLRRVHYEVLIRDEHGNPTFVGGEENWVGRFNDEAMSRAVVVFGMLVGRWPARPRDLSSGWDSSLTFNGEEDYSFYEPKFDLTVNYSAAQSKESTGRTNFFGSGQALIDWYDAHPSRESKRFVYLSEPSGTFGNLGFNVIEGATYEPDELEATLRAQGDANAELVRARIESEGDEDHPPGDVRDVELWPGPFYSLTTNQIVAAVPVDTMPAGALAGVVEQAGAVFYVWRRVEEDRAQLDKDRNQGDFRYQP